MKKIIDINRFFQTLRWETMTEQKDYLRCVISLGIVMTFLFCLPVINLASSPYTDFHPTLTETSYISHMHNLVGMAMFTCVISLTLGSSWIFRNMQTKQQRISFLMLPATSLEKYLVRYLHVSVGYFVCFCIALAFADLMHFLFLGVMTDGMNGSVIFEMLKGIDEMSNGFMVTRGFTMVMFQIFAFFVTLHFLNNSFWIFCGTLFRRNAWFFTLCLQFLLLFFMIWINFNAFNYMDLLEAVLNSSYGEVAFWIGLALGWVVVAILYFFSYRLFCRMQVINNKWVNL